MGWSECKNIVRGDICGCQQFEASSRNPFACGSCDCHKHFHGRPEDDEFAQYGSCSKIRNFGKCGCQKFLASTKHPTQCSCCSHPPFLHLKDQLEEERARALKRVKLDITVQSTSNAEDEQSCITKTRCMISQAFSSSIHLFYENFIWSLQTSGLAGIDLNLFMEFWFCRVGSKQIIRAS